MKKLLITVFSCLLGLTAQVVAQAPLPNQLLLPSGHYTLPLHWKGDSLNHRWEPQAALLIPVTLPGSKRKLFMQFDTGSPSTIFYRQALQAFYPRYTPSATSVSSNDSLTNFQFKAGPMSVKASKIAVIDFEEKNSNPDGNLLPIIGTIGTDLLDNKVVIIDYPRKQLVITDKLPAQFSQQASAQFIYAMRRILLPATIDGRQSMLYFDSGSSAFELLTDKATCYRLASDTNAISGYPVQSWGKTLTAHSLPSTDSITMASRSLPLRTITWIEGANANQVNQMMRMGIGGMTGNKLFMNHVLILDITKKQFSLVNGNEVGNR